MIDWATVIDLLQFLALLGGLLAILGAAKRLGVFEGRVITLIETMTERMERGFAANTEFHKEQDRKLDETSERVARLEGGCKYKQNGGGV